MSKTRFKRKLCVRIKEKERNDNFVWFCFDCCVGSRFDVDLSSLIGRLGRVYDRIERRDINAFIVNMDGHWTMKRLDDKWNNKMGICWRGRVQWDTISTKYVRKRHDYNRT